MLNVPLNDGGAAFFIDGVMGRVHGSRRDPRKDKRESRDGRIDRILVEIDQAKYSTSPKSEEETTLHLRPTDEYPGSGSGELSGDSLARFHGLILPRSRGFGDKQPLERSWVTSSVMFMSRNSDITRSGDLDSLPSWISDHLGEGSSFMTDEINQSPPSPMEGSPEASPLIAIHPSVEEKTNIMTLEELNALRDTYSFLPGVRIRLPDEGGTITSTRPGEVAFYEAAFPASLHFPLHPTIRLILQFYNICPAQLVPNTWRSIACSVALWRAYFKARNKKVLLGGYPSNVKGWKSKLFFIFGDEWEIPKGTSREGTPRVPRMWGISVGREDGTLLSTGAIGLKNRIAEYLSLLVLGCRGRRAIIFLAEIYRTPRAMWVSPQIPMNKLGGNVLDPILDRFMNAPSSSSNPSSESCSDSSLPVELESDAMSKRISFKKIGEKLRKSANVSSGTPVLAKGVVIGEKRAGKSITSSPSKKGKADDGSKGKGIDSGPEGKKKATSSSKAPAIQSPLLRILGKVPRLILEKVEKLTLDQTATKLFHVISQALVLGSSLAVHSREAGEKESLQEGRVTSMETEANDELAKMKSDRDSLADKLERSGVLVNELREALNKAKESAVEEFKSSSEFVVAVEDSASKYLREGFDFCKVQLRRHHPDLAIDLEGTVVDQDLLVEQDETAKENEKEKLGENKGFGGENSFGEAKLAASLTAIRMPVIL
ncbi:hypothetical protein Acr_00g0036810 [Actinidia rufa]|uniref:Transposase (putative) gypsy type domain-containing protein n=1 Tax=Actinidia rufa TaxID=165716 RepID=A0A7J0DGN8_9ERIC|nr:hypothetical protein Acr_00g0036810 [Actinidia rufa]